MSPKVSFTKAAYMILAEEKTALSSYDILQKALAKNILETSGRTPEATMYASMLLECQRKGNSSRFLQIGNDKWCLSEWGKEVVQIEIEKYNAETQEIQLKIQKSIVGDPLNFDGLTYSPINENGVIFLFGKVHNNLGIIVESIQTAFPDARGRKKTKRGWLEVRIEFEYKSSNFKLHKHPIDKCDLIICWIHDWKECPLEVVELKSYVEQLLISK